MVHKIFLAVALSVSLLPVTAQAVKPVPLKFENLTSIDGTDQWDWWQARTAYVPAQKPYYVTTMSETGKTGTHNFHDIYQTFSEDGGQSWSQPEIIPTLRRHEQSDGYEVAPGDLWPKWHAASKTVLITGKTFNFKDGTKENFTRERVSYAVMDPKTRKWGPLKFLKTPEKDHAGFPIIAPNAGCNQRVDLPDGDVLLPVRYQRGAKNRNYTSVVMRCGFDGKTLTYKEHGSELNLPKRRGFYEPSLEEFQGKFYLTLRTDRSAFVTSGSDGIHFDPPHEWKFDDGKLLGSHNTQQHWVTVGDGLFLIYTRRGANNDHIIRNRAPLFIGQVDPESLRVIRKTERILLPENHATLGNSGTCRISDNQAWVTCGEGMLAHGKRKRDNNKVLFVKITPE